MGPIIDFFYGRPVTATMLFAGLFLWGIVSVAFIPVSLMPPASRPAITVITRYPGIAPTKIEDLLTRPLEEQIIGVGGIESIYSSSEEGESRINVVFTSGTGVARKSLEVRARIDLIRDGFPREVEEPAIIRYDPTDRPVLIIKLDSDTFDLKELRDVAENKIKKRLERVDGISEIRVGGGFMREINVDLDGRRAGALGLSTAAVMQSLQTANVGLPAGRIRENDGYIGVRVIGKFSAVERINDVVVAGLEGDRVIKLKDIARVRDGFREREDISRENGREIVSLYVHRAGDAHTLQLCDGLLAELDVIQYPGVKTTVTYNQSRYIRASMDRVHGSALVGGCIAVLILFVFLRNVRATLAVAVSIPLSIGITFMFMHGMGVGIHIMSLSGLALGTGMLIDNSIVVLEFIFMDFSKSGFSKTLPAKAARKTAGAILAATLTNIAVFFPVYFSSQETRELYGGLATAVSSALLVSMIVSLIFLPVLAGFFFRRAQNFAPSEQSAFVQGVMALVRRGVGFMEHELGSRPLYFQGRFTKEWLQRYYVRTLLFCMRRSKVILGGTAVFFAASMAMTFGLKQEYIDPLDTGEIHATVELETGIHLDATNRKVLRVEEILRTFKQVESLSSRVKKWHADIFLKLRPDQNSAAMIKLFKKKTDSMRGGFVYYVESGAGQGGRELDIEFIGDDNELLRKKAREAARLASRVDGVQETVLRFREGKQELRLQFDHRKGALAGISADRFGSALRTAVQGGIPTKFIDDGREVDIKVRFRRPDRKRTDQVRRFLVQGRRTAVPAGELVSMSETRGESRIYRKNKRRIAVITIKLGELDMGTAAKRIGAALEKLDLPENYYYEFGGNFKKLERNRGEMYALIFLALFLVYSILAALFESFRYPLVIILTIPMGACGVVWTLTILDMSLNVSVYIGIVMLAGIVVNNSIMLVDQTLNNLRGRESMAKAEPFALYRTLVVSCRERMRPILMTTLTTVLAMIPLALDQSEGSRLWRPLAVTVISGLGFSAGLTLILTPLIFLRFYRRTGSTLFGHESEVITIT